MHGHGLCYECNHNNLCGGVQREGCEIMKIDDVEKLVKVVIETHGKFFILFGKYLIIFCNG